MKKQHLVTLHNIPAFVGDMRDCLGFIAIMLTDYNNRHKVTAKEAVNRGFQIHTLNIKKGAICLS